MDSNRVKHIEEIARDMCLRTNCDVDSCIARNCETTWAAVNLYNKGYRKVIEGKWIKFYDEGYECSSCGTLFVTNMAIENSNYCPRCGAHMIKED